MRVVRASPQDRRTSGDAIFIGEVAMRTVAGDEASRDFRIVEVHFHDGARNRWHTHTTDQVLVITDGDGTVASRTDKQQVVAGDVALIPAGEEHWHGAQHGKHMTHLAITGRGSKTTIIE